MVPVRDAGDDGFISIEKAHEVPFAGWVKALVFTKGGQYLVVGGCQSAVSTGQSSCASGLIHEWNMRESTSELTVEIPRSVTALAVSQDGARWVAGDTEGRLIHSTATRAIPKTAFHQKGEITSLAFSADGRWIVSGSTDPYYPLGFLDVATGGMVKVKVKFTPVSALTFSPDGKELAIGMRNGSLVLWEFNAGTTPFPIISSSEESYAIESLVFSPDGHRLAYGRRDGRVVIWDRQSGQPLIEFKGASSVTALTFSPDGRYLTIGQENGKLLLVETETGREAWTARYHLPIQDLAFSPDGTSLAIAVQQRVYLNRVRGAATSPIHRQQADRLPDLDALRVSKRMPAGKGKRALPVGSSKKLAEVMNLSQNEYMWLLPFDSLAVHIMEAMAGAVEGITIQHLGVGRGQVVLKEGERSVALNLTPLQGLKGKEGLQQILRILDSAQQFVLVTHPDAERALEEAAVSALVKELGLGVRLISSHELKREAMESVWQREVPVHTSQAVVQESLLRSTLGERIGYMKLDRFTSSTARRVQKWLIRETEGALPVVHVLDLRDNEGSDLSSLIETASILLPKGQPIAWVVSRKDGEGTYYKSKGSRVSGLKLVVLVNERTAGTAELLACAIRESNAGLIVGSRTAGVDEMFTIFPVSDGSGVRISTERFYCPGKRSIRWEGQRTDVEVGRIPSKSAIQIGSAKGKSEYHAKQLAHSRLFINDNQLRAGVEIATCWDRISAPGADKYQSVGDARQLLGKCWTSYN
jgi:hypothetical protein